MPVDAVRAKPRVSRLPLTDTYVLYVPNGIPKILRTAREDETVAKIAE